MARTPTVTIGRATGTGQNVPKVTIGRAYGQSDTGAGTLEITELTGSEQRTLRLSERALPYKPIAFGVKHRIESTTYAGARNKSQQALGGEFLDTEIKGAWKTRFLGDPDLRMAEIEHAVSEMVDGYEVISNDSTSVRTAAELVAIVEDFCLKGQVVRVSWLHHVRVGRIAEFEPTWQTAHDCEWRIKFDWIGKDDRAPAPAPGGAGVLEMTAQLSAGYVELHDATNLDDIGDLNPSVADQIDSRVGRIQRGILELEDTVENRVASATGPIAAMRRAMAISTFIRDEAQNFIDDMDRLVAPALSVVEDPTSYLSLEAGRSIRNACAIRSSVRSARILKHRAARIRYQAMRQLDANAIAVLLMAQDEDVATLSQRYYGTPDEGERIRSFNDLPSNTAPVGTVIVIPALGGP